MSKQHFLLKRSLKDASRGTSKRARQLAWATGRESAFEAAVARKSSVSEGLPSRLPVPSAEVDEQLNEPLGELPGGVPPWKPPWKRKSEVLGASRSPARSRQRREPFGEPFGEPDLEPDLEPQKTVNCSFNVQRIQESLERISKEIRKDFVFVLKALAGDEIAGQLSWLSSGRGVPRAGGADAQVETGSGVLPKPRGDHQEEASGAKGALRSD